MDYKALKVGDKVVLECRHWRRVAIVNRVASNYLCAGDYRFSRKRGHMLGERDRWNTVSLIEWSDELEQEIIQSVEVRRLADEVSAFHFWRDLSKPDLEAVVSIIRAHGKKGGK
jgi:hypothetical protein